MDFKEKYNITAKYLTVGTKRRSGRLISPAVKFIVLHDTGNLNSTAASNIRFYESTNNKDSASAHIFVDDKEILECIPAITSDKPEKAWHVLYNKPNDNELFGCEANDVAIGIEYCYGDKINADEAYKRYVWTVAYTCYKFNLDPKVCITAHCILDPERKTDPKTGLAHSGRTYEKLLEDIFIEYNDCKEIPVEKQNDSIQQVQAPNFQIPETPILKEENPPDTKNVMWGNLLTQIIDAIKKFFKIQK